MLGKAIRYLQHQLTAKTRYGVHSPFVFEFVTQVLPAAPTDIGQRLESLRKAALQSSETVTITDYGAGYGGRHRPEMQKTLPQVIRSSARGRKDGELLYRICKHYQPPNCLELGTNLGFSTAYQAAALPRSRFVSIEGAPELSERAGAMLKQLDLNVELMVGEFSQVMENDIDWDAFPLDFVLMDGNHRYAPTLQYFHFLLPKLRPGAILIVDDIHWSAEMQKAWKVIRTHPEVTVSIDLYDKGICFLKRNQAKEHFRIRI